MRRPPVMRLAARLFALVSALSVIAACSGAVSGQSQPTAPPEAQPAAELTVFAAASLSNAFEELGRNFERANPGTRVVFSFAGSQQLAAQLGQGAPADVFASADVAQMAAAVSSGRVGADAGKVFVRNQLVVVASPSAQAPLTQLQELARPGLKLVFAADAVPVGRYTLAFLDKAAGDPAFGGDFKDAVLRNVVSYEDNVRAVLTKVSLGEGDAGVVYASDVVGSPGTPVARIDIPDALNVSAGYPVAPVADARNAELAQKFVDFLLAGDSQRVLTSYGFTLP